MSYAPWIVAGILSLLLVWQLWRHRDSAIPTLIRERDEAVRLAAGVIAEKATLLADVTSLKTRVASLEKENRDLIAARVDSATGTDLAELRDDVLHSDHPSTVGAGAGSPKPATLVRGRPPGDGSPVAVGADPDGGVVPDGSGDG